jgi:hypothetical protein
MTKAGSIATDPSEQYLRLLKGEITPQEYARSVEKRVDAQDRREEPRSQDNGAAAKRQGS